MRNAQKLFYFYINKNQNAQNNRHGFIMKQVTLFTYIERKNAPFYIHWYSQLLWFTYKVSNGENYFFFLLLKSLSTIVFRLRLGTSGCSLNRRGVLVSSGNIALVTSICFQTMIGHIIFFSTLTGKKNKTRIFPNKKEKAHVFCWCARVTLFTLSIFFGLSSKCIFII